MPHMAAGRIYYVYIMTNQSRTLYVGYTNNIRRRVHEHKNSLIKGFTNRYNMKTLVYFEYFNDPSYGIAREKQIKN